MIYPTFVLVALLGTLAACTNGAAERRAAAPAETATRAAAEPRLEEMARARPVGKIGVPVDVRYLVTGAVARHQPASVQLAFVPRTAGTNLEVRFPDSPGITIESGARDLRVQKAAITDVLRHSVLVTPTESDSGEMRAIVSMELDGGRFFGIYAIPIGAPPPQATKPPSKD